MEQGVIIGQIESGYRYAASYQHGGRVINDLSFGHRYAASYQHGGKALVGEGQHTTETIYVIDIEYTIDLP